MDEGKVPAEEPEELDGSWDSEPEAKARRKEGGAAGRGEKVPNTKAVKEMGGTGTAWRDWGETEGLFEEAAASTGTRRMGRDRPGTVSWGKEMNLQVGMTLDPEGVFAKLEKRGCFEEQKGPGARGWQGAGTRLGTEGDKAGSTTAVKDTRLEGSSPTKAGNSTKDLRAEM